MSVVRRSRPVTNGRVVSATVEVRTELVEGTCTVEQFEEYIRNALEDFHRMRGGHMGGFRIHATNKRPTVSLK